MLFVTAPEEGERYWIPLDRVCLVAEDTTGYKDRELRIFVLEQEEALTLRDEQEIGLFLQALSKAHNNDVVGNTGG